MNIYKRGGKKIAAKTTNIIFLPPTKFESEADGGRVKMADTMEVGGFEARLTSNKRII